MTYLREAWSASVPPSALARAIDIGRLDPIMLELYGQLLRTGDAIPGGAGPLTKVRRAIRAIVRVAGLGKSRQINSDIDPIIAYAQKSLRSIADEMTAGNSRSAIKTDRLSVWKAA